MILCLILTVPLIQKKKKKKKEKEEEKKREDRERLSVITRTRVPPMMGGENR